MKLYKYLAFASLAVVFTACDVNNELDEIIADPVVFEAPTAGAADFSKFVSVGASFTAGTSDGSVFLAAQSRSFPAIMAQQMRAMGGGDFNQPLVSDNVGGLTLGGTVIAGPRLFFNGAGPAVAPGTPTTEVSNILSGPFNNFGVPGAKSFHLLAPGYGNILGVGTSANPYYVRMASAPMATVLADAVAAQGTFFSISEIGGNDVLGYATSGGTGVVQTGNLDPTTYGPNDITDPQVFASALNGIIQGMTANGAKGIIATVPSIVNLPHFTTVPYNAVPLDEATATQLNAGFAAYNGGLDQILSLKENNLLPPPVLAALANFDQAEVDRRKVMYAAGQNAVLIEDETLTDLTIINPQLVSMRPATPADFLVLPSSSVIGTVMGGNPQMIRGVSVPLADQWVLIPEEQQAIQDATNAYNVVINNLATANDLALVDLDAILREAAGMGTGFDDFTLTASLVFGGLVSLDGIHLTSRGYALMANKFLEAIDDKYGSNFKASGNTAKADNYPTNYPPGI